MLTFIDWYTNINTKSDIELILTYDIEITLILTLPWAPSTIQGGRSCAKAWRAMQLSLSNFSVFSSFCLYIFVFIFSSFCLFVFVTLTFENTNQWNSKSRYIVFTIPPMHCNASNIQQRNLLNLAFSTLILHYNFCVFSVDLSL